MHSRRRGWERGAMLRLGPLVVKHVCSGFKAVTYVRAVYYSSVLPRFIGDSILKKREKERNLRGSFDVLWPPLEISLERC